jgi:hypothetical protein
MSQRGSPSLRRAVWQAALTTCRFDPMGQALDDRQRKRGQPLRVARSHGATTLRRVIDAVRKGQRPYDPYEHVRAIHG